MFEQHISSDILFQNHQEDDNNKIVSGHLYLRQPHTVIQLVEVASPPPRRISSVIISSSSSASSSSSSSSFEEEEVEEEVEEYCSSDEPLDDDDDDDDVRGVAPRMPDFSLSGRMKRILLWREQSPQDSISLKRKLEQVAPVAFDNVSKRSRSSGSNRSSRSSSSRSLDLGMHSCPACDAFFPTRHSLRLHGRDTESNEACAVAVEYAFE